MSEIFTNLTLDVVAGLIVAIVGQHHLQVAGRRVARHGTAQPQRTSTSEGRKGQPTAAALLQNLMGAAGKRLPFLSLQLSHRHAAGVLRLRGGGASPRDRRDIRKSEAAAEGRAEHSRRDSGRAKRAAVNALNHRRPSESLRIFHIICTAQSIAWSNKRIISCSPLYVVSSLPPCIFRCIGAFSSLLCIPSL